METPFGVVLFRLGSEQPPNLFLWYLFITSCFGLLFSALTLMFVRSFIWLQTENKMGGLKYYLAMGTNLRKRRSSADGSTWSFKQILRQQGRVAIIFLIEWSNTSQQMRLWLLPYKAGHNFDSVQKDSIQDNWISWYSANQMRKLLMKSFC